MQKTTISVKVIADSINPKGKRITTLVMVFPRIILAELNTHRAFTRNSASSRAIPAPKMLEMVSNDPFIPIKWMKDHSGMQGNEYFEDDDSVRFATNTWLRARNNAVSESKMLNGNIGVTKQFSNRLLEPFLWHTAIVTATDWENFFALRAEGAAEIHIQDLAYKVLDSMNNSEPKSLKTGEWHIPFGDNIDVPKLMEYFDSKGLSHRSHEDYSEAIRKIAAARCARVSYLNFDGTDDYGKDIALFDRLASMGHCSPMEHVAMALDSDDRIGNFSGWKQLRFFDENQNKKDSRLLIKEYKY